MSGRGRAASRRALVVPWSDDLREGTMRESDTAAEPVRDVSLGAARYRADRDADRDRAEGDEQMPAGPPQMSGRMQYRTAWVDRVVDQAIARGEFENLPLAGKP